MRAATGGDGAIPTDSKSAAETEASRVVLDDNDFARELLGREAGLLPALERGLGVRVSARGNVLTILGEADAREGAEALIGQLADLHRSGHPLSQGEVAQAAPLFSRGDAPDIRAWLKDVVLITPKKRAIHPRSPNQKRYVDAIRAADVVFGLGPAGTGKTYLAVAMAVAAMQRGDVRRIVLTRPAVEAGEKLGFLPGDLAEKIDPYLRPLYDALHDMLEPSRCERLLEQGTLEIAPLAFMRGRTLERSFIILDEAQNTTPEQMKMFLTRLGVGSRAVVTGDHTQIDLPGGAPSGLLEARRILRTVDEIPFIEFDRGDVVRHLLVQRIIDAYEADDRHAGVDPRRGRPRGGVRRDDP